MLSKFTGMPLASKVIKCMCSHLRFFIFVMFSTFQDEMQCIFVGKNFIIMDVLAVNVAETDVIFVALKRQKKSHLRCLK